MGFLEHSQMIAGNYPDIQPSRSQPFPAFIGRVRGEEGLHASPEKGETARIDSRLVLSQRPGLCASDLAVLLGELKEIAHFFYEL